MIQGIVKTWYPNGKLESQREFNQNKKHGTSVAWYENGDVMLIEDYDRDLLLTASYFKIKDPNPTSRIEQGRGIATLYTSHGIFLRKISYEKGKPKIDEEPLLR
jgi:antitoxin component YwqK of YwqJK toxin-antitoxin module